MPVTASQKSEIENVIQALLNTTSSRKKRRLADMFSELPDRDSWPEYYEVIPEPRCISGVAADLEKDKYKDPLDVYNHLSLVFYNALYYNEESSQIAKDAAMLKSVLDNEWKQRSVLPIPRTSPPPSSAQKVYANGPTAGPQPAQASTVQTTLKTEPAPAMSSPTSAVPPSEKSPERQPSPDMDVDVGGTPEPEGPPTGTPRDGASDEIVRQLEKGLPRWEGFADVGWMEEVNPDRHIEIITGIREYEDATGFRLAASLEAMPEDVAIAELPINRPLSLSLIESRVNSKHYPSSKAFDREVSELFLKARRWYEPGSDAYGHLLTLQRLYHALTSLNPPPGPPYTSTTYFASLRAGPGTAKPLHTTDTEGVPGVTTFRVSTKDRTFVDEVQFKGWSIRLADWLHLSNPDDPSKPIIGQVFKCYISDEPARKGQPGLTVCWYFRPEQTFHPAHRQFWENEVFKTSHFADHPLEDVIEKIACQFTARHIRGRPRPPFWYPGWPLYVCDSRYNDRERIFVKIKNWNSCVPEEVRKSTEFMPIYPFEDTVFPRRFASPFLSGKNARGPGGIGDVVEKAEGERVEGGGTGRKRPKRNATGNNTMTLSKSELTDRSGPSKGLYVGVPATQTTPAATVAQTAQPQYSQPELAQPRSGPDTSILNAAGGANNVLLEKLPPETARHFDRDPVTNEVLWFAAPPMDLARTPTPRHSLAYLHFLASKRKKAQQAGDAMEVDAEEPVSKRHKAQPTMTETVDRIMAQFNADMNDATGR
ncbi:uncharacterized protein LAESUDRAFT_723382 [Laetiporus sulphureus 93-53]|uniref:BAH-domain-containing protein n=1 Tax=Laetiporus sulphureus 93-53 TaxID=1314785 RepID=A0A165FJL9_9APHY|nr:uncharacterized protein LAESUDRAFT_723382 [Laetiporus sulphureus 93-53]KZT09072.1 hypothetical protein LAESUDRAFT_723382 [Laetiporus sulphureus 93-53]